MKKVLDVILRPLNARKPYNGQGSTQSHWGADSIPKPLAGGEKDHCSRPRTPSYGILVTYMPAQV